MTALGASRVTNTFRPSIIVRSAFDPCYRRLVWLSIYDSSLGATVDNITVPPAGPVTATSSCREYQLLGRVLASQSVCRPLWIGVADLYEQL